MKLFSFILALLLISSSALAKDTALILPAGPGSTLDLVGRTLAVGYKKATNKDLIPENRPGGDMLIGFSAFQKDENSILLGAMTLHAFNYHFRSDPINYTPDDFYNVSLVGWQPQIWYASAESGIRTPQDLVKKLPSSTKNFIAGDNTLNFVNADAFLAHYDKHQKIKKVRHKTSTDVTTAVAGGFVDVGVGTLTPSVLALVQQGKLFLIGSSATSTITVNGISIPSIGSNLNIPQFNGGYVISLNPKLPKDLKEQIKKDFYSVLQNPETKAELEKLGLIYVGTNQTDTDKILKNYRDTVGRYKQ